MDGNTTTTPYIEQHPPLFSFSIGLGHSHHELPIWLDVKWSLARDTGPSEAFFRNRQGVYSQSAGERAFVYLSTIEERRARDTEQIGGK